MKSVIQGYLASDFSSIVPKTIVDSKPNSVFIIFIVDSLLRYSKALDSIKAGLSQLREKGISMELDRI